MSDLLLTLSNDSGEPLQADYDVDQWEHLELTSKDPCRTDIVNPSFPQDPVYVVRTNERGAHPITTYRRATDASGNKVPSNDSDDNVIATLEWHLYRSDKLCLRGGKKQTVGDWLKRRKVGRIGGVSFTDEKGKAYIWKPENTVKSGQDKGLTLQLFTSSASSSSHPIALFVPATKGRLHIDKYAKPASILYSERAAQFQILDKIVLSALLIEKSRAFSGKGSTSILSSRVSLMGVGLTTV
ncbi:uncharacterized protein FOMMEDRAFT_161541 [Fomitiporia mediterranea MF3/22]|uniref:uncharacterized protein n=1 Tax=Fomitiporia mediterranea (strain MF3/22) TaxID=694068 RepID=UPI000440904D|nr:uncharacterized protein FOMMEDRAFT_161541 [Fomitiporia mediterranea MF3/22]EJC98711.1 hypothetical protein FOMMEDRAFT_161541 [Fomitiporia mediterranea MF3/22]